MLSDEEKKEVDELKKEINNPVEVPTDKFNTFILYNIESARTILNLIEKQSKEIEELKNQEATQRKINELLVQRYSNSISLQKIKDKIEEYKNMLKTCNKAKDIDRIKAINERILELQELIEGEK